MENNGIRLQNKTGKTCKDKWTEVQPQPNGEHLILVMITDG